MILCEVGSSSFFFFALFPPAKMQSKFVTTKCVRGKSAASIAENCPRIDAQLRLASLVPDLYRSTSVCWRGDNGRTGEMEYTDTTRGAR